MLERLGQMVHRTLGWGARPAIAKQKGKLEPRGWREVLAPEVVEWCDRQFRAMYATNKYSCVDNERVGVGGWPSTMRRYRKQQASGCCGFVDVVIQGPDGRYYFIGFNHGH